MKTLVEQIEVVRKHYEKQMQDDIKRIEANYLALGLLRSEGFSFGGFYDEEYFARHGYLPVKKNQLTAIRRVLGRLEAGYTDVEDAEKGEIKITMYPKDPQFCHMRFCFMDTVHEGGRCHIEETMVRQAYLVCTR